jgi:hypothetical protein
MEAKGMKRSSEFVKIFDFSRDGAISADHSDESGRASAINAT